MSDGASNNERLLAAAREDNEELLLEVFDKGNFDVNCKDGLGNTPSRGNLTVLEHILSHEECDVDPINRIERATPLHLALRLEDAEVRKSVAESLLEAGADITIKDKNGETAFDLLRPEDEEIRVLMRKAKAQTSISNNDIAEDDDDEPGSDSGSESD
ncbi:ankyrin [Laetiporus sulphureus 93-53]|uniref:Ankyrin n=1 Tax=Laetiporus sulphureus 93-53 TaxID=1314785 RepID=A0A165C1Q1_9APHY|nr:ankyrin [Laetiporus sulphureus 93-53]KZT02044.1 ankyrin [Laetiporus sulphureus 93-53]